MPTEKARRPSPLQRNILIVLAALDAQRPGPVATKDIERLLAQGGDSPVYGNNLRSSCRRMEAAGWLHTLRNRRSLQLAVELTDAGRAVATPLLAGEQERMLAEQRATEVMVLPLVPVKPSDVAGTLADDRPVLLDNVWHMACRGYYVVRLDGTTCLQLWNTAGQVTRLAGDPLQVAQWLQACHDSAIDIRLQINESTSQEDGWIASTAPADHTETWYRQLESALQVQGISGLTDEIRQAVVMPGESLRYLRAPERLLCILREVQEAFPLTADAYEENTGATLDALLARAGFTAEQAKELRMHRIRWPLMSEEAFALKND